MCGNGAGAGTDPDPETVRQVIAHRGPSSRIGGAFPPLVEEPAAIVDGLPPFRIGNLARLPGLQTAPKRRGRPPARRLPPCLCVPQSQHHGDRAGER